MISVWRLYLQQVLGKETALKAVFLIKEDWKGLIKEKKEDTNLS